MRKNILGIIPARGGSKGIPRKNLFPINGKPLIQYTIEAAKESRYLSHIALNSEDDEIRHFAERFGVDVSYHRPEHLATDTARQVHAIMDMLDWLEERNQLPDIVVLLQPTSPLRTGKFIDDAVAYFLAESLNSLVGVHQVREHPCVIIDAQKTPWHYLVPSPRKNYVPRRQELSGQYYAINGTIYIATPQWIRAHQNFTLEGHSYLYPSPPEMGVDIDHLMDVYQVEAYLKMQGNN